jgi:predicted DNA-binding ribbon-helix-helix protein
MKKMKNTQNVKMNLSLERNFYELLQERAKNDYVKVATWTKQYLMKGLLEKNNSDDSKCLTKNGTNMEL